MTAATADSRRHHHGGPAAWPPSIRIITRGALPSSAAVSAAPSAQAAVSTPITSTVSLGGTSVSSSDASGGSPKMGGPVPLPVVGGAQEVLERIAGGRRGGRPPAPSTSNERTDWGSEALPPNVASKNHYSSSGSSSQYITAAISPPSNAMYSSSGSAFSSFYGAGDSQFFPFPRGAGFSFDDRAAGSSAFFPSSFTPPSSAPRSRLGSNAGLGSSYFISSHGVMENTPPVANSWESQQHSFSYGSSSVGSKFGAGGKYKKASRGLRFMVDERAGERGVMAFTKPRAVGDGTVAVVGKHFFKLLNVPTQQQERDLPTSWRTSSSISSRRSRSRGSPTPFERGAGRDASPVEKPRGEIKELVDMRAGAKLGPGYLFSDVRWGYFDTANKLVTSFSNGSIALWDPQAESASRYRVMQQHDRAVNQVMCGGPAGNYILSAGQDGQIKIWDLRIGRALTHRVVTSSPVQRIKLSPSASQPWTLVATCSSGTMIRLDLRNLSGSKSGSAMTDRINGHVGACQAMDWRDNYGSNGTGRRDGGWVVTGGADKTIKIWDFSLPILSTRPVRTLHSFQPIQDVAWHPTKGTEIAAVPMPPLGAQPSLLGGSGGDDASTPGSTFSLSFDEPAPYWKNTIEIWDTRRPALPKLGIKTHEAMTSVTYHDEETVWCASKTSAIFRQVDTWADSFSLLESVPRPEACWSTEGELTFVGGARASNAVVWERQATETAISTAVDAPIWKPDSAVSCVADLELDTSPNDFAYLANTLCLEGGEHFVDSCEVNAEIYESLGRTEESQLWATLKVWLSETTFEATEQSESPPALPPPSVSERTKEEEAADRLQEWLHSPKNGSRSSTPLGQRRSFSTTRSREKMWSSSVAPGQAGPSQGLDAFSEESSASEHEISSPDEIEAVASTVDRTAGSVVASEEGPSEIEEENERGRSVEPLAWKPSVEPKSRRSSSGMSTDRRPPSARGNFLHWSSRRSSMDRTTPASFGLSRRNSEAPSSATIAAGSSTGRALSKAAEVRAAAERLSGDANEVVKAQLRATLQEWADKGDAQLCATVVCVVKDLGFGLAPLFAARVTKAYLDLLRQSQLQVAAAALLKHCDAPSVQALVQQKSAIYDTSCGSCGKALEQPSSGACPHCTARTTRCSICHLSSEELFVFCTACGHGAHPACVESYASSLLQDAGFDEGEALSKCPTGLCGHSPCILAQVYDNIAV